MKNIDLQNRRAAITGEVQGMGLVRGAMVLTGRIFDLNYNRPNY